MTDTQWARIASDIEYLRALVHGAFASPLVWLPLALCVVVGAVSALRWFNERHSYTHVGRNASLASLALACLILVAGAWSHADTTAGTELPSVRASNDLPGTVVGGQG